MSQFKQITPALAIAVFVLSFVVPAAEASTYFVAITGSDSLPGTEAQPLGTIKKGISLLKAGDTLYIRGGTYSGATARIQGSDFTANGTSWENAITVAGYPNETIVLKGTDGAGIGFTGSVNRSYIIVQDIAVDGILWTGANQLLYVERNNHHLRFQRLTIQNAPEHSCLVNGDYIELLDSVVDTNNRLNRAGQVGSGWYGAGSYQLVEGNEFKNMRAGGVRFFDSDLTHATTGSIARKNRIHDFSQNGPGDGFGILLGGANHQAYNNIIYNGAGPGIQVQYGQSNIGNLVYNNTITNVASYGILIDIGSGKTPSGTLVKNNIVFGNAVNVRDAGSGTIFSNNLTANPLFVNAAAGDFRVQPGSPAIDAGTTIATVLNDFHGVVRPSGLAYDIGAYEGLGPRPATNVKLLP